MKKKAPVAEAKKEEKATAVEAKKKRKDEKASATSGSMIIAEGHTRGLIAEHGDIKFHQGGVLHWSFRTTQGDI